MSRFSREEIEQAFEDYKEKVDVMIREWTEAKDKADAGS